jgi:predicted MFS family arabinose efflux permease
MLEILENHRGLYSRAPKMEKITFDVSLAHFLLMFGYKLFSLYYPLFLVSIGFSVMNVGGIYLLTYSIIAIFSVAINYYIHRLNPSKVAALGIAGYGVFALLMLLSSNIYVFYSAQIILGVSAAAWLVSLRLILMKSRPESKSISFGWFYSMPHYASVIAPVIGGAVIWKFGFAGVFALSVLIQFANAIYAYARLNGNCWLHSPDRAVELIAQKGSTVPPRQELWSQQKVKIHKSLRKNYSQIFSIIKSDKIFALILIFVFATLILGGIYRAFFVLFLENLSFSREEIIKFIAIASIAYLPLSIITIKIMGKLKSGKIISGGITAEGIATIILGFLANALNLLGFFAIMLIDSLGALMLGSGKSSLLCKKLKNYQEEASTIDTVLTTLGPALGALIGGIAISYIGFQNTFLFAGAIVFLCGILNWNHK